MLRIDNYDYYRHSADGESNRAHAGEYPGAKGEAEGEEEKGATRQSSDCFFVKEQQQAGEGTLEQEEGQKTNIRQRRPYL
jgi:hypothetical protein